MLNRLVAVHPVRQAAGATTLDPLILPVQWEDPRPVEVVLFRCAGAWVVQDFFPPLLVVGTALTHMYCTLWD